MAEITMNAQEQARCWPRSNNSGVVSISDIAGLKLERGWQIPIGPYRGREERSKCTAAAAVHPDLKKVESRDCWKHAPIAAVAGPGVARPNRTGRYI